MSENGVSVKKPARGLFFYFKVLLVFVALISISFFIAVYYVYHHLTSDGRLESMIMEKASAATSMDIKFSGYELSFPGVSLNNIIVATDSPDLKIDARIGSVKLRPDLWAAINGEFILDSLSIASISAAIETGRSTGTSQPAADKKEAGAAFDPASIKLPFNSIDVQNVRLNILQRETSTRREVYLKNANLTRSILSSSMPFNIEGEVVSVARLVADGKLYWPANLSSVIKIDVQDMGELKKLVPAEYHKQFAYVKGAGVEVELRYNFAGGDLNIERCQLRIEPGIKADATIKIGSFSPFNASASVKIAPVDIPALWPLVKDFVPAEHGLQVKSGRVGANIEVSIVDAKPQSIVAQISPENVSFSASAIPAPVQLNKGQVSYDNGKITFNGFVAAFADSSVEMAKGSLTISPLVFDGEMKFSADLASIQKMAQKHLSKETQTVLPTGKIDFAGKIHYDSKGVKVNGNLNSAKIDVKESKTGAHASIEKVKVSFVDLSSAKGQLKIESLEVKGVGASVVVQGTVTNTADMGFDVTANGNLNIEEFSRLAASLFKLPIGSEQFKGGITLDVKLAGTMANLKPSGKLVLKNVSANLVDQGLLLTELNGAATADLDKLVVEGLSADLLGGRVKINGTLKNFKKPVVDAKASVTSADLAQIRKLIKKNVPAMPDEIEFSGKADLSVDLTGSIAEPVVKGEAVLAGVRFFHPSVMRPVEDINGPVTFTNIGLTANNVTANWGKSKAKVSGQLKDWARFVSDFKYSVEPLDVTDAAGFFLKDTGYVVQGSGTGNGTITGPVEKIKVDGVASVPVGLVTAPVSEKGEVFKFPYKNLVARFTYSESIFAVTSADLELFSGKINGSGKVFLASEPIKFEFDSKVQNVQTQEFLKENTKYPGVLTGGLNGTFNGQGNSQGLTTLNGNSSLSMPNGSYNSPPMIKQISQMLNAPQLDSGTINNAAGEYKISGGRITSNNVVGTSSHGKVVFVGSLGLDATIDGEAKFQMTRQACLQSNVLREMIGDDESLEIPITVKGSMMSPSIGIPLDRMIKDAAQRRGKQLLQKEAGKMFDKLLGGGKKAEPATTAPASATTTVSPSQPAPTAPAQPAPAQPQPAPQKQIEQKVKDLGKDLGKELNKLFKRK